MTSRVRAIPAARSLLPEIPYRVVTRASLAGRGLVIRFSTRHVTSPLLSDRPIDAWVRGVRSGDLDAFESLFRQLHPMLIRVASSIAETSAEAEDAVQETFVRLWEQRDRIDPGQSLRAYLVRSVRNRSLNGLRDARTRQSLLYSHARDVEEDAGNFDEAVDSASRAERIRTLLAGLPERQRMALMLTRFDGLSHVEAADAMGCSVRTVNNHIVRGLRTLRDRLQATDFDGF